MTATRSQRCRPGRLAVPELAAPLSGRRKLCLTAEVLAAYCRVRWWLWRHEVREVVALLRAWDPAGAAPCELERPAGEAYASGLRLGRAVTRTLRLLPTDGRCLMRSLVLTGLLARRGISSTLVIGVLPGTKLAAHAWVEHGGRPLLDAGEPGYGRLVEL